MFTALRVGLVYGCQICSTPCRAAILEFSMSELSKRPFTASSRRVSPASSKASTQLSSLMAKLAQGKHTPCSAKTGKPMPRLSRSKSTCDGEPPVSNSRSPKDKASSREASKTSFRSYSNRNHIVQSIARFCRSTMKDSSICCRTLPRHRWRSEKISILAFMLKA